jgi:hypothetical protein
LGLLLLLMALFLLALLLVFLARFLVLLLVLVATELLLLAVAARGAAGGGEGFFSSTSDSGALSRSSESAFASSLLVRAVDVPAPADTLSSDSSRPSSLVSTATSTATDSAEAVVSAAAVSVVEDKEAFASPATATSSAALGEVVGMKDESLDSSFITSSIFMLAEVLWYNREMNE